MEVDLLNIDKIIYIVFELIGINLMIIIVVWWPEN